MSSHHKKKVIVVGGGLGGISAAISLVQDGYDVSVFGAVVGAGWAFGVGFFWGWFAAFSRNLVYAIWLMTLRIRTDFSTSRDFLDHI